MTSYLQSTRCKRRSLCVVLFLFVTYSQVAQATKILTGNPHHENWVKLAHSRDYKGRQRLALLDYRFAKAGPDDVLALTEHLFPLFERYTSYTKPQLQAYLQDAHKAHFILWHIESGQIAAAVKPTRQPAGEPVEKQTYAIDNLAVAKGHRGKGLASLFVDFPLTRADSLGMLSVMGVDPEDSDTMRLYTSRHFTAEQPAPMSAEELAATETSIELVLTREPQTTHLTSPELFWLSEIAGPLKPGEVL